jgi:hypothetical protein
MRCLFMRLWWGLVALECLALPSLAQSGIVWLRKDPAPALHIDVSPDNRWMAVSSVWSSETGVYSLPERHLVRVSPDEHLCS